MSKTPQQHPMALAMEWVVRIIVAGLLMVLPGLAGEWIDDKFGTGFLVLLGFGVGIGLSLTYLISASKANGKRRDEIDK